MYSLKRMAIREGYSRKSSSPSAAEFSQTFVDFAENYGRSFELGVATRFILTHNPLGMVKIAPMGIRMLRRGRMELTPKRIKGIDQLKAILAKAKELGGES